MKEVGIKEFQRSFPGILENLPITLTRKNTPIAIILPPKVHTTDKVHTKKEGKEVHTRKKVHTEEKPFRSFLNKDQRTY